MIRFAVALVAVSASIAHAAPCSIPPKDPKPRAMQLELVAGHDDFNGRLLAPAQGAEFPAISADGKRLAQLFVDSEDFTGAPITTLVVWSSSGIRLAGYRLGGKTTHGGARPEATAAQEADVLHDANAQLATTTWRPLAFHPACGGDQLVKLDGATLAFDEDSQRLTRVSGAKRESLGATFPAVGERMYGGSGGCGGVRALFGGFGGPAIGIAVLLPHASLGGDSCFGLPAADTALAITIQ